ncbi:MAG TPA: GYD domain-containing protein [Thermoplasmata archaeon]|nr:GYD domain-containing protein [Thermoplasmata archaeon]
MPHYVVLGNWTEQGIRTVKDVPKRVEASRALIKKNGGELHTVFVTMGKYDWVAIMEAPNDDAVMQIMLTLGAQGNTRTTTMKAWTPQDAGKVLAKIP